MTTVSIEQALWKGPPSVKSASDCLREGREGRGGEWSAVARRGDLARLKPNRQHGGARGGGKPSCGDGLFPAQRCSQLPQKHVRLDYPILKMFFFFFFPILKKLLLKSLRLWAFYCIIFQAKPTHTHLNHVMPLNLKLPILSARSLSLPGIKGTSHIAPRLTAKRLGLKGNSIKPNKRPKARGPRHGSYFL